MFRARRPIPAPFKAPSSAYTTSPPSCQGLALASTSCGKKAHPETGSLSLFFCDLRVCACKLVDARPKAWHDDWGADGAEPLLRPLNLTPMGLGPGIHEFAEEKAHPATQDRALFFRDLRVRACELVDARPKAWHDERGADGAKPLLWRHHLTPM